MGKPKEKKTAKRIYPAPTKDSVDLTNWWGFNSNRKYPITQNHESYFNDVGYEIYAYARRKGYSVMGSALMLTLSANESGYGDSIQYKKSVKQNNYWGIKIPGTQINRIFDNKREGEEAGVNLIETDKQYIHLRPLLRQDSASLSALDSGLYSYDPVNHPRYATYLHDTLMEGILVRDIELTKEKLADLQSKINPYISEVGALSMSTNTLTQKQEQREKKDINTVNEFFDERSYIIRMQQELQTGQSDKYSWYIKGNNRTAPPINATYTPPPFVPQFAGANLKQGMQYSAIRRLAEQLNQGEPNYQSLKNSVYTPLSRKPVHSGSIGQIHHHYLKPKTAKTKNGVKPHSPGTSFEIPGTGNISQPRSSRGGGSSSNISVNVNTNDSYHTHAVDAPTDIQDELLAILTSAVSDSRISTDLQ